MRKYIGLTFFSVLLIFLNGFCFNKATLNEWLAKNHCVASVKLTQYDYNFFNKPTFYKVFQPGEPGSTQEINFRKLSGK
jgi:hypothetical protein